MKTIIQKEILDTHKKMITAIEMNELELAVKYEQIIKELEQHLKALD